MKYLCCQIKSYLSNKCDFLLLERAECSVSSGQDGEAEMLRSVTARAAPRTRLLVLTLIGCAINLRSLM